MPDVNFSAFSYSDRRLSVWGPPRWGKGNRHACTSVHMMILAHWLDMFPFQWVSFQSKGPKRGSSPRTGWVLQPPSHACVTCESWSICQWLGGFPGKCIPRFESLLWFGVVPWPPSCTGHFSFFQWILNWNQLQIRQSKNLNLQLPFISRELPNHWTAYSHSL